MPFVVGQRYRLNHVFLTQFEVENERGRSGITLTDQTVLVVSQTRDNGDATLVFQNTTTPFYGGQYWLGFYSERDEYFIRLREEEGDQPEPVERFLIFNATTGRIIAPDGQGSDGTTYDYAVRYVNQWFGRRGAVQDEMHLIPVRSVTKITAGGRVEDYRQQQANGA